MTNREVAEQYVPLWDAWHIESEIGSGNYGSVFKIYKEDFKRYEAALKVIQIPKGVSEIRDAYSYGLDEHTIGDYFEESVKRMTKEIELMYALKGNSNIVSYEEHIIKPKLNGPGYDILIKMELLEPLSNYLRANTFSEKDVLKLGIDICSALESCEAYNIIHRDIKEGNIFVTKMGNFKLGDFGIAKDLSQSTMAMTKQGTPMYIAPEVESGKGGDKTIDIYLLGLVLYKIGNHHRMPFTPPAPEKITDKNLHEAMAKRLRGEPLPLPLGVSKELGDIINKACAFEPKNRFESATAFKKALLDHSEQIGNQIVDSASVVPIASVQESDSSGDQTVFLTDVATENSPLNQTEYVGLDEEATVTELEKTEYQPYLGPESDDELDEGTSIIGGELKPEPEKKHSAHFKKKAILVFCGLIICGSVITFAGLRYQQIQEDKVEAARVENEKIELAKREAEKAQAEKAQAEKVQAEKETAEKAKAQAEKDKVAKEAAEKAKVQSEEAAKREAAKLEAEKQEAEKKEAEKQAIAKREAEKLAAAKKAEQPKIIAVTSVTLNKSDVSLSQGEVLTVSAVVKPTNATNQALIWVSSAKEIASVDSKGKITAKSAGKVTITAKTSDGKKSDSLTVVVSGSGIEFGNAIIEKTVRGMIGKSKGEITESDVKNIYHIDLSGKGLVSLSGIENLPNLKTVNLSNNEISSISKLAYLPKLTKINLKDNNITSFSAIKNLKYLKSLYISGNPYGDLSALSNLEKQLTDKDF